MLVTNYLMFPEKYLGKPVLSIVPDHVYNIYGIVLILDFGFCIIYTSFGQKHECLALCRKKK